MRVPGNWQLGGSRAGLRPSSQRSHRGGRVERVEGAEEEE